MSPRTNVVRQLCRGLVVSATVMSWGCGSTPGLTLLLVDASLLPTDDPVGDRLPDLREQALGAVPEDPAGVDGGAEFAAPTCPVTSEGDRTDCPGPPPDSTVPSLPNESVSFRHDEEPNDTFARAVPRRNFGGGLMTLEGRIDRADDVDVFELGGLAAGDHLRIDLIRVNDELRPCVAVFDADEIVFGVANDPYPNGGPDVPGLLDAAIRRASPVYYFAVASHREDLTLGVYRFDITITRGGVVPPTVPQIVVLDFDGARLSRPLFEVSEIDPFDAASIAADYAGMDDVIKHAILEAMEADFAAFNVSFVTSDDLEEDPAEEHSTLYFGSPHESLFGAAVGVDEFNDDRNDYSIVFTEGFTPARLGFTPPPELLGLAIGNIASHELGHLLGLNHVEGATALMNMTLHANDLIVDQGFATAPLAESVFPLGRQDPRLLLAKTVGER